MGKSREYLAIKNFVHNTCGVSKEAVREMVFDCVRGMTDQVIRETCHSRWYNDAIGSAIERRMHEIRYLIAHDLASRYIVEIKKKGKNTEESASD